MIINYLDDYMFYLPFWPRQKALAVAAVEMRVEAAFGHQLIDKQDAVATTVAPDRTRSTAQRERRIGDGRGHTRTQLDTWFGAVKAAAFSGLDC